MIKVLIVDDSLFMRRIVSDMINAESDMKISGMAKNGVECLKLIPTSKPDVVILDLEMPVMGGLETLIHIMKRFPMPVIVLSGYESKLASASIIAIELGAIDFVPKPGGQGNMELVKIKDLLLEKIRIAVKAKVTADIKAPPVNFKGHGKSPDIYGLTVIASSTGGVRALSRVIPFLPLNYPTPILVVQHMPAGFTKNFSKRLNTISKIEVKEAVDGEIINNGVAYIAAGDFHLKVEKSTKSNQYLLKLSQEPKELGVRPCANKLFESVANLLGDRTLGLVLTGMGKDGARGSKILKSKGATIFTEDESTCVIYGMPKEAAPFADKIIPLSLIADDLTKEIKNILKNKCSKKQIEELKIEI
ncbi:MAG: chemotaxis response regulator protein-glutamate methylesterase [archaeon]|nr:chemotaxis response regulator protein-glutamate methylesterase [archaeon]